MKKINVNGKTFELIKNAANGSWDIYNADFERVGYAKTIPMARKIAERSTN